MMRHSWRLRLRAVISDYHRAGDRDSNFAASILCELFCANLSAIAIVPALDEAIGTVDDANVAALLSSAREHMIGDYVTAADITDAEVAAESDFTAARAFNDRINVALCDVEHRASA